MLRALVVTRGLHAPWNQAIHVSYEIVWELSPSNIRYLSDAQYLTRITVGHYLELYRTI